MWDLHMHSAFSDGKDTAEEMVRAAVRLGMECVGLSEHSHTAGDDCGMTPEGTKAYREEMDRLKKKYAGQIRVLCGLERDFYSDDTLEYDYVIGSVHWIRMEDGHRMPIDWTAEKLRAFTEKYYRGDWYAMAEAYYGLAAQVVEATRCDIIGHFDLVTKFIETDRRFDVHDPRYVNAWQKAADELLKTGKPFEINTGAMSRGYRSEPYPAREIRDYLRARGGKLILSSDSHRKETIGWHFGDYAEEAEPSPDFLKKFP